ncbi:MAG: hypothetical protein ACRD10_05520, partial [Terriglobia bacterium]
LPEQWVRQQESTKLANSILIGITILLGGGLVAGAVWLFVRQVRRGAIRWGPALKVAIVMAVLIGLAELNRLPGVDRAYNTSISFANFRLQVVVSLAVSLILGGVLLWLAVGLATSLYPEVWQVFRAGQRRIWRRDAAIALVVSLAVSAGIEKLVALFADHAQAYASLSFPLPPRGFDALSPGFGAFAHGLIYAIGESAVLGVAIYGICLAWRRRVWWFWPGAALVIVALGPAGAHSLAGWAAGWLMRAVPLLVAIALIAFFFRNNPLAYVLAAFCSTIATPLVELLSNPAPFFRWNGVLLGILAAATVLWLLAPGARPERPVGI